MSSPDGTAKLDQADQESPTPRALGIRPPHVSELRAQLRQRLKKSAALVAPGATDALGARLVERAGFEACYVTGAGIANQQFGLPDVGLISMTEVVMQVARIASATSLPLIVDADTGYGGPLSVMRTVRELERAGAAAIQIEDQQMPKRCGHFDNQKLISVSEMTAKIEAAREASGDSGLVIIARTDACNVEGLDEALRRGEAYAEAGADALFIEAIPTVEQMGIVCGALGSTPLVANMVEGGRSPELSVRELEDLGFRVVIHAAFLMRVMLKAGMSALAHLREAGETKSLSSGVLSWADRQELVGLDDFIALEDYFSRDGQSRE